MQTNFSTPLTDVLLVAGPPGAGKSTFIHQLLTGQLAPAVEALLPNGAKRWTPIEANGVLNGRIPLESVRSAEGIIFHYATLVILQRGLTDYRLDPVFSLLDAATKITIVNIHPLPETLVLQFEAREYLRRANRGRASIIWGATVRTPLRRAAKYIGKAPIEISQIYRNLARIELCYREWDAFARELVRGTSNARIIYVESQKTFALVARPQ